MCEIILILIMIMIIIDHVTKNSDLKLKIGAFDFIP